MIDIYLEILKKRVVTQRKRKMVVSCIPVVILVRSSTQVKVHQSTNSTTLVYMYVWKIIPMDTKIHFIQIKDHTLFQREIDCKKSKKLFTKYKKSFPESLD